MHIKITITLTNSKSYP